VEGDAKCQNVVRAAEWGKELRWRQRRPSGRGELTNRRVGRGLEISGRCTANNNYHQTYAISVTLSTRIFCFNCKLRFEVSLGPLAGHDLGRHLPANQTTRQRKISQIWRPSWPEQNQPGEVRKRRAARPPQLATQHPLWEVARQGGSDGRIPPSWPPTCRRRSVDPPPSPLPRQPSPCPSSQLFPSPTLPLPLHSHLVSLHPLHPFIMNSAFVATSPLLLASPRRAAATATAPRMAVAPVRRAAAQASASLAALAATAAPVLATEGTGEGLGIDNALLYVPLLGIPAVFLFLFLQFGSSQVRCRLSFDYIVLVSVFKYWLSSDCIFVPEPVNVLLFPTEA